jgi:hypothetical protein
VGNFVMGLLILPVSKNSAWSSVFGVTWEAVSVYHQVLGYLFLATVLTHMGLFWKVYAEQLAFPHDIFATPLKVHANNPSTNMAFLTVLLSIPIFGGSTFYLVRRAHYELFYYLHFFSGVMFLFMLWHATSCWYFITAGLVMYAADVALRLTRNIATTVVVSELTACVKARADFTAVMGTWPSAVSTSTSPTSTSTSATATLTGGVVKLAYTVQTPLTSTASNSNSSKGGQGQGQALSHLMGQHCFVNIPSISLLEWHPFSISSAPCDSATTHHISVRGDVSLSLAPTSAKLQWTAKLYALANKLSEPTQQPSCPFRFSPSAPSLAGLQVNIEGPYGLPPAFERYSHVLFVGGGIGITPLHSCLRALYLAAKAEKDDKYGSNLFDHNDKVKGIQTNGSKSEGDYIPAPLTARLVDEDGYGGSKKSIGARDDLPNSHNDSSNGSDDTPAAPEQSSLAADNHHSDDDLYRFPYPQLASVKMLWSVKTTPEAMMFEDTVSMNSRMN